MSGATLRAGAIVALACVAASAVACGGHGATAKTPRPSAEVVTPLVDAYREEAKGDPDRAITRYLNALEGAAQSPTSPWAVAVEQAAIDALVARSVPALADVSEDSALVYRTNDPSLAAPMERGAIYARLVRVAREADDPFSAGIVARGLLELAEHRGDEAEAARWRAATGCAREATILGPLTWTAVTGVEEADPLAAADAPIAPSYAAAGAFAPRVAPVAVRDRGCTLDPFVTGADGGVRDVVVDVTVPKAQTIGVALRARTAATLRVGGKVAIVRAFDRGGDPVARFARVDVPQSGALRIVARVGAEEDAGLEIDAWDEHGRPLAMRAPGVGERATLRATAAQAVEAPAPRTTNERVAAALGALAADDPRTAEDLTSTDATKSDAPPEILLAYARAMESARDLDASRRAERARGAYERVLEAWPGAWEAVVAHAVLAGVRRGQSEARIESLRDLDQHRARGASGAILDVWDAATSGRDPLHDRAKAALARARAALPKAAIVRDADRAVVDRCGPVRAAFDCSAEPANDRSRLDCFDALRATGDHAAAARELDRLRALQGAPKAFLPLSLREAVAANDVATAARLFDAMLPGERSLAAAWSALPRGGDGAASDEALRRRILAMAPDARDAPAAIPPLLRASGDDPAAPFEGIAARVVAEDRAKPILPHAATAILAHRERYDVDASGLARWVLFDVRRVSGTTDVEENAQAYPPDVDGRGTMRIVRRRIFKRDGRVLEPERNPSAAQSGADLAQLEQGDAVEAIYEGWALPNEARNVAIDTPDLLPDRTAVHDATIELRAPKGLRFAFWSHPLLGKATESTDGGARVLRWALRDAPERRLEAGVPKMDRDACVSFSTATWDDSARSLRETLAGLEERNPEIAAWAREEVKKRAGEKPTPRAIVDAVVDAVGSTVKESSSSMLSDLELGPPSGPQAITARTILTDREGSRTWVIVRALRELGVAADVVVAENEPFSADPSFPPHDGRFTHPLAVAHVQDGAKTTDVWIDADVPGPPLPAGRISPELRGRAALHADGTIALVPPVATGENERDEVDVRLVVDDRGDAKGSLTVLLRGRAAQELAEALVRIVGDERQRALRGVALGWVPFANVDSVQLSSSEGSWQVALRAELTIPAYAQPEGNAAGAPKTWVLPGIDPMHVVFPRPYVTTLSAAYAFQGARREALAVNRAVQYHVHRRVELPKSATVARVPGAFELRGPLVSASRKIAVAGSAIEEDFALSVATGTVAANAYGGFVTDAHRVDDAFLASTRVKP